MPLPQWQSKGNYSDIRYEIGDGIAKITINRPEVRNAFRPRTLTELIDAFHEAHEDPEHRSRPADRSRVGCLLLRR